MKHRGYWEGIIPSSGKVVQERREDKTLGFPQANLEISEELYPKRESMQWRSYGISNSSMDSQMSERTLLPPAQTKKERRSP